MCINIKKSKFLCKKSLGFKKGLKLLHFAFFMLTHSLTLEYFGITTLEWIALLTNQEIVINSS